MFGKSVYTAIDIGSTKVCTLIGRLTKNGESEILGVGTAPSKGLLQDTVVNIDELAEALAASVSEASRTAGTKPSPAFVGLTGTHFETLPRTGSLWKSGSTKPISPKDLEKSLEQARPSPIPQEKELVHLIAREYRLDGTRGILNPVGMHAIHLEANALAVLAGSAQLENLMTATSRARIPVRRLVFQPLAFGDAVLSKEERNIGALVIDIGGGTTSLAFFWRGVFWDSRVIPVGGHHLTNDIAVVLGTPSHEAEEAKRAWGAAQPWKIPSAETVQLLGFDKDTSREVSRKDLSNIIHERASELLQFIHTKVGELGLDRLPAAGAVLMGGTASLPGLKELAQDTLARPVRIGTHLEIRGGEALDTPAFASCVGIFLWGLRHDAPQKRLQNRQAGIATPRRLVPHLPRAGR